jgi:thymidylate synthase
MCLPPCHIFFQCYVDEDNLDIQVYMRSVDLFLGLPFDIASYALLQRLIAREVGLSPRRLLFSFGDAHIYLNHIEAVRTVLERKPHDPPQLILAEETTLFRFKPGQALLVNYNHYGKVEAKLNV